VEEKGRNEVKKVWERESVGEMRKGDLIF